MLIDIYNKISSKIKNTPFIKKYPNLKELMKYSLVGNFSNLIDFGLYIFLTRAFSFWRENYLIANLISLFVASLFRFIFHKQWTFRDSSQRVYAQYFKLILLLLVGLLLNEAILFISVEFLVIHDLIGKLIAVVLGTLFIYYFTRTWVFGKPGINFKKLV